MTKLDPILSAEEAHLYRRLADVFFAPFTPEGNRCGFKVRTYQLGDHAPIAAFHDHYTRQSALSRAATKLYKEGAFDKLVISSGDIQTGLPAIGVINLMRMTSPQKLGMSFLKNTIIDPSSIHTGTDLDIALRYARLNGQPNIEGKYEVLMIARPWHALRGALTAKKKQSTADADFEPIFYLSSYAGASSAYFAKSPETLCWMWSELSNRVDAGIPKNDSIEACQKAANAPVAALPGYEATELTQLREDLESYLLSKEINPGHYARLGQQPDKLRPEVRGFESISRIKKAGLLANFAKNLTACVPEHPLSVASFAFDPADDKLWNEHLPGLRRAGVNAIVAVPSALGLKGWQFAERDPELLQEIRRRYNKAGIDIVGMQSIGLNGYSIFSQNPDDHERLQAHITSLCKTANILGVKNLNFGAGNNRDYDRDLAELDPGVFDGIISRFRSVANIAKEHNVTFALEPVAHIYGGNYGRSATSCIDIADKVGHPNFKIQLDTFAAHSASDNIQNLESKTDRIAVIELSTALLGGLYQDGPNGVDNTSYIEMAVQHNIPINIEVKARPTVNDKGRPAISSVGSMEDLLNSTIIVRAALSAALLRKASVPAPSRAYPHPPLSLVEAGNW